MMNEAQATAKLKTVLQQMVSHCKNPDDQSALKSAELFHNIQGLPMDIVGFSVPINSGSNRAYISFTLDHFSRKSPEDLASEGLNDFQTAKSASQKGP
jgi:hypothetical protein